MKDALNKINPRFYMLLSGLLLGISIIFADVGFVAYIALLPLAFALYNRTSNEKYETKKAYLDGFIFYMAYDLVAFHWFVYFYPLDFAGIGNAEAIGIIALAWIGLSALQSVFSALVFVLIAKISKTETCQKYTCVLPVVVAALFVINEWTQTFTWAGIPWSRIAISQTEMPILIQTASLFGSYFLTFIVVLFNFLLAKAIISPDKKRFIAGAAALVFVVNALLGSVLYLIPTADKERDITVASLQGNIESQSKNPLLNERYKVCCDLVEKAALEGAELVVLSEGAFPIDIEAKIKVSSDGKYEKLSVAMQELAKKHGVTVVLGTYCKNGEETNTSISAFYPDGSSNINAYAKRRPVPFGEFLPLASLVNAVFPSLAAVNIFSDVTPGEKSTWFYATEDEGAIKVGTLLCFDSIYEQLGIDASREGAEMLIIPSNDSWFYDSRALYMHHSQNILRAVEQGKYAVECANSGITSIITDKGEIISDMPIYEEGYIIDTVYASSGRTLYSYIGNLFVYICIAFLLSIAGVEIYNKKKNKA